MIFTELKNIGHYHGLGYFLDKAVDYLCAHTLGSPQAGRYEIAGEQLYMNVFDYTTISEENAFFEAHQKYADIHILVSGEECVGVSDMSKVCVKRYEETQDFCEIEGPVEQYIKLVPGKVLILLPEDAHKVKLAVNNPTAVKKIVLKVYVGIE